MADELEAAAAALAAAVGSQSVPASCASALRSLLPGAHFLRASVRCGSGLLVSGDLLQPGHMELSLASLQRSLAGVAISQRQPVVVAAPGSDAGSDARQVLCLPIALHPVSAGTSDASPSSSSEGGSGSAPSSVAGSSSGSDVPLPPLPPLYVGAFMLGCSAGRGGVQPAPPQLWAGLQSLAAASAPYLLIVGANQAEQLGELLRLRSSDRLGFSEEGDELQDLPLETCAPPLPPGGGAGGAAGALAPAGADAGAAGADDAGEAPRQVAAAAALAQESSLPASAARQEGRPSGSGVGKVPCGAVDAAAIKQLRSSGGEEADDSSDPKAVVKRRQAAAHAAAAEAGPPPPVPSGLLLRFADPTTEARFAAAHNRSLCRGDALFAGMHLSAALCVSALQPACLGSWAVQAFVLALVAPLLALAVAKASYQRYREALLVLLLVSHAALLRTTSVPSLLRLLRLGPAARLPWLLRITGAEALAVFPIGFKLRFHVFLPIQAVCIALVAAALPLFPYQGRCDGCSLSDRGFKGGAALLALSWLVPAVAVYHFEARARQRFLAAEHRLRVMQAA